MVTLRIADPSAILSADIAFALVIAGSLLAALARCALGRLGASLFPAAVAMMACGALGLAQLPVGEPSAMLTGGVVIVILAASHVARPTLVSVVIGTILAIAAASIPVRGTTTAGLVGAVAIVELALIPRIRARRHLPNNELATDLVGRVATVRRDLDPEGMVFVMGSRWRAACSTPVAIGARVRITRVDGLQLTVEPAETEEGPGEG